MNKTSSEKNTHSFGEQQEDKHDAIRDAQVRNGENKNEKQSTLAAVHTITPQNDIEIRFHCHSRAV